VASVQPDAGLTNTYTAPCPELASTARLAAPAKIVSPEIATELPRMSLAAPPDTVSSALCVTCVQPDAGFWNRAHGGRPPSQAHPPLEVIREAGIPSLVVSGGHQPALERMCDAVAAELGGARLVAPGAGHFVAAAPGFAPQLEAFLDSAGA